MKAYPNLIKPDTVKLTCDGIYRLLCRIKRYVSDLRPVVAVSLQVFSVLASITAITTMSNSIVANASVALTEQGKSMRMMAS